MSTETRTPATPSTEPVSKETPPDSKESQNLVSIKSASGKVSSAKPRAGNVMGVAWAYALVEDREHPGRLYSLELEIQDGHVVATRTVEPSWRSESRGAAEERLCTQVKLRGSRRAWSKR